MPEKLVWYTGHLKIDLKKKGKMCGGYIRNNEGTLHGQSAGKERLQMLSNESKTNKGKTMIKKMTRREKNRWGMLGRCE